MMKILMYHRVVDDWALSMRNWTCVHKDELAVQLSVLRDLGFVSITLEDYLRSLGGPLRLPPKTVIVTFDDGYKDTYTNALPILEEFGVRAVVFVHGDRSLRTNIWDTVNGWDEAELLGDEELVAMRKAGMEIGAHSFSHARLTEVSQLRALEEIHRTKINLERLLGSDVKAFSYPYGLVNSRIKGMIESAGFKIACSVYSGPARYGKDLLEMRRITIPSGLSESRFSNRMRYPYERLLWSRWWVKHQLKRLV